MVQYDVVPVYQFHLFLYFDDGVYYLIVLSCEGLFQMDQLCAVLCPLRLQRAGQLCNLFVTMNVQRALRRNLILHLR